LFKSVYDIDIDMVTEKTPEFIPAQLWPPNSPDLNSVEYSMQEKVHKIRTTDLDELKQRLRTE